jgi:pimeloyl-ACP methyl ester carboxylesterase
MKKLLLFFAAIFLFAYFQTVAQKLNGHQTMIFKGVKTKQKPDSNRVSYIPTATVHGGYNSMHFPYPVIFMHGLIGSAESWTNFRIYAEKQGWTYGGKLPFCLNEDGNNSTENITSANSKEIKSFIPGNLPAADFYAITFNTDTNGTSYSSDTVSTSLSSSAAIIKGGKAIGMAINAVLKATGKKKVILFCHSMGGLDARAYIQNTGFWQSDGQHHVAKLTTSGTPHGGSNVWGGPVLDYEEDVDEQSDAIRDLRTTFSTSGKPGVFLFGGVEDTTSMDDSWLHYFYSYDVNCNGHYGDTIIGLNQRPMPSDIDYTCIVSDYHLDVTDSCGDYLVLCKSANIKNYYPSIQSETFSVDTFHDDMPSLIHANFLALDEPDSYNLSYEVDTNIVYNGFITVQAPDAFFKRDYDNYTFSVSQKGTANVLIKNMPVDTFGYSISALSNGSVVSSDSMLAVDSSLTSLSFSLSPGNYNLKIWGNPNDISWKTPYNFIINFKPDGEATNIFDYNGEANFNIFPNPSTNTLIIKTRSNSTIEILSIEGQFVKMYNSKGTRTSIDVSDFPNGMYFVKIKMENRTEVRKFIKQ